MRRLDHLTPAARSAKGPRLVGMGVVLLLSLAPTNESAVAAPQVPFPGRSDVAVEEGELTLVDGQEVIVVFKTPFQTPPRLSVIGFKNSWFTAPPYRKEDFTFVRQAANSFTIHNNHADVYQGAWATIKWRAEGVRAPQSPGAAVDPLTHVKNLGGKVQIDPHQPLHPVAGIDLHGTQASDADVALLARLPDLRTLNLYGTGVTDAGLSALRGLTKLQILYLNETRVTDAGLASLKGMTGLHELGLYHTGVTDNGLPVLRSLPGLQKLTLGGPAITDRAVAELKKMNGLKVVALYHTSITAGGLQDLQAARPRLQVLYLR